MNKFDIMNAINKLSFEDKSEISNWLMDKIREDLVKKHRKKK